MSLPASAGIASFWRLTSCRTCEVIHWRRPPSREVVIHRYDGCNTPLRMFCPVSAEEAYFLVSGSNNERCVSSSTSVLFSVVRMKTGSCCNAVKQSCCHTIMLSGSHTVMLSDSHAVIQSCSHTVMLSYHHAVRQSYSHAVIQPCCNTAMLSYNHAVIQSCCHTVMLSYSHAVIQPCCNTDMLSYIHAVIQSYSPFALTDHGLGRTLLVNIWNVLCSYSQEMVTFEWLDFLWKIPYFLLVFMCVAWARVVACNCLTLYSRRGRTAANCAICPRRQSYRDEETFFQYFPRGRVTDCQCGMGTAFPYHTVSLVPTRVKLSCSEYQILV